MKLSSMIVERLSVPTEACVASVSCYGIILRSDRVRTFQDLFSRMHFSSLICINKVSHSLYLRVILIPMPVHNNYQHRITQSFSRHGNLRLCFLAVERIHFASREHVSEHEVLKDLDPLWRARFIVVPKRFEEILACAIPLACRCCKLRGG